MTKKPQKIDNIECAEKAGRGYAEHIFRIHDLNDPYRPYEDYDDLPNEDYVYLRNECGEVTLEMEKDYKHAFNTHGERLGLFDEDGEW